MTQKAPKKPGQISRGMRKTLMIISMIQSTLVGGIFIVTMDLYDKIPEQIPIRWNTGEPILGDPIHGQVSRYFIYCIPALMLAIQIASSVGMRKSQMLREPAQKSLARIGTTILGLFAAVQAIILAVTIGHAIHVARGISAAVTIALWAIGKEMPNIPPNNWIGIRTPWTLRSEFTWVRTHQFAGIWLPRCALAGAAITLTPWPALGLIVAAAGFVYTALASWRFSRIEGAIS